MSCNNNLITFKQTHTYIIIIFNYLIQLLQSVS
jgi:hypothetical protein